MDINCTSYNPAGVSQDCIYAVNGGNNNCKIQYCYVHDCPRIHVYLVGGDDLLLEYNLFAWNNYSADIHGEPLAIRGGCDRIIIRYNRFVDNVASGIICTPDSGGSVFMNSDWEIYGNIVAQVARTNTFSGFVYVINYQSTSGWKIYNNTIVDCKSALFTGVRFVVEHPGVTHTNNHVYNNLWYNCGNAVHIFSDGGTSMADYNWYYNTTHTTEANQQLGTGDPFVDRASHDYRLAVHTNTGKDLGLGYNTDMDGEKRLNWDMGAYEYVEGGGAIKPNAPQGLRIVN
jgi:hypothetical protein